MINLFFSNDEQSLSIEDIFVTWLVLNADKSNSVKDEQYWNIDRWHINNFLCVELWQI